MASIRGQGNGKIDLPNGSVVQFADTGDAGSGPASDQPAQYVITDGRPPLGTSTGCMGIHNFDGRPGFSPCNWYIVKRGDEDMDTLTPGTVLSGDKLKKRLGPGSYVIEVLSGGNPFGDYEEVTSGSYFSSYDNYMVIKAVPKPLPKSGDQIKDGERSKLNDLPAESVVSDSAGDIGRKMEDDGDDWHMLDDGRFGFVVLPATVLRVGKG